MGLVLEGNGVAITRAGLVLKPKKITLPGASREEIDVSTLLNEAVTTSILGALYTSADLVVNYELDPATYGAIIDSGNLSTVITFPDNGGTITMWCDVKEVGDPDFSNNEQPVFDVTFKVTNLNASNEETPPVYAAGS